LTLLNALDWQAVRTHYDDRIRVHNILTDLHQRLSVIEFANFALAILVFGHVQF